MFWIYLGIIFSHIISMGVIALIVYIAFKERQKILDRLMAEDFRQFKYYEEMFKGEVKELKKARDAMRKTEDEDEEIKKEMDLKYEKERKFLEQLDEDFPEEDVDLEALRKRIDK